MGANGKPLAPLTPRQQEVLGWVWRHLCDTGGYPSFREACAAFGLASLNSVACYVERLERKGWLLPGEGRCKAGGMRFSLAALARLRSVRAEGGRVVLELGAPALRLTADEARALAEELLTAAGEVSGA